VKEIRFRLFAGPNGSGKTTVYESIKNSGIIKTEFYISADKIEEQLKKSKTFSFNQFSIVADFESFSRHIKNSGLFLQNNFGEKFINSFSINKNLLHINLPKINSYHASFIATYVVEKLFEKKISFCFETVMSHQSKVELLKVARTLGYKTYLYFVYTNKVQINIDRIKSRVIQGKHDVAKIKVIERYQRSFNNLKSAMLVAENIYLLNNSDELPIIEYSKTNNKIKTIKNLKSIITQYI
jgi:predicted ABC-type ATPase